MSVLSEVKGAQAASASVAREWDPTICETVLSWMKVGPSAAVGWDASAWEEARWTAVVHGVAPVLYRNLHTQSGWTYLAPEFRQWLEEQYRLNGQRARRLMSDLETFLSVANQEGIQVVPLKGSVALYTMYADDPALRPMADIDVLIRHPDEERVTELLAGLGYILDEKTPRHRTFQLAAAREIVYTRGEHPDNPRGLEVHVEVGEQFWGSRYELTNSLWEGEQVRMGSTFSWLSSPFARMQHLLVHGSADVLAGKVRLARLFDAARLAADFDDALWHRLVDEGLRRGEARWLYTPLVLIERYLDAPIPAWVVEALGRQTPPALRAFVARSTMYQLSFCNPMRISLADRLTWHRPGIERAVALWHCLVPTPTQLRNYYPELAPSRRIPYLYAHHLGLMVDGARRLLLRVPRRSWLYRHHGGK